MKQILLLFAVAFIFISKSAAQTGDFKLTGTIVGDTQSYIYFSHYNTERKRIIDSVKVDAGNFTYSGTLDEPTLYFVSLKNEKPKMDDPNMAALYLEPGVMTLELVSGKFQDAKLQGAQMQRDQDQLTLEKKPIMDKMQPYIDQYDLANDAYIKAKKANKSEAELDALLEKASSIKEKFTPFSMQLRDIDQKFISSHPDHYLTAYLLGFEISSMDADSAKAMFDRLTPRVQRSKWGAEISKTIDKKIRGAIGKQAATFSTQDISGKLLNLADYKGKYVLLDFWASWCVPCRKGNPHLLKLYAQYKNRGFEIIGIADDDSTLKAWRNAVAKDGIGVWKHVLRGLKKTDKGFDYSTDISDSYDVHSLPTKILIDPTGTIIGRYGDGGEGDTALDNKLNELFK